MRFSISLLADLHCSVGPTHTPGFEPALDLQSSWTVASIFFQALFVFLALSSYICQQNQRCK